MNDGLTLPRKFHVRSGYRSQQELHEGEPSALVLQGRIPRVSRLMALAIRLERLIQDGAVKDQAELARLGHVSRARISQILSLTLLAPDIQEQILFLPPVAQGRDPIKLRDLLPIARTLDWKQHRRLWRDAQSVLSRDLSRPAVTLAARA